MQGLHEGVCDPQHFICFIIKDYRSETGLQMCVTYCLACISHPSLSKSL